MATENTSNNGNCCTSCGQTNCNNLTCGCADSSLTTPCGYSGKFCPDGNHEKCEEVYCENCVANCESKLEFEISSTTSFVIEKGERLSATLQKLVQYIINPACVTSGNEILNIMPGTINNTSIQITWDAIGTNNSASALQVRVKIPTAAGWTNITPTLPTTATSYTITGLQPNTEYMFSVLGVGTSCTSASIYVTTNP
tara:strand:+ start:515 stop:1108 length:594 start_codon:yes stop_codon:yes gene_type:complete